MKKIFLIPLAILLSNCSGIAPEATRDDNNPLVKPPFMETKLSASTQKAIVEIYSKPTCPYCVKAKALFDAKKITYKEHNLTDNPKLGAESVARSGGLRTVPQIFINGKHIGGYTELNNLATSGELEKRLAE